MARRRHVCRGRSCRAPMLYLIYFSWIGLVCGSPWRGHLAEISLPPARIMASCSSFHLSSATDLVRDMCVPML